MKASDNPYPSLLFEEHVDPAAPAAGHQRLFIDTDHHLKSIDSSSTVTDWTAAAGNVATDTIWAAQGDIVVATGNDAAAVLTKGAAGTVPTAGASTLAYAYPPGYEYSYVENTSSTTNITHTTEATADTIVTAAAVAFDGSTAVIIEFFTPGVVPDNGAAGRSVLLWLYDGSSSIGALGGVVTPSVTAGMQVPVLLRTRITPSAATHTYSVRGTTSAGTAVIDGGAGGTGVYTPTYIRITKA